jgi:polyhydroxybutyrate depolymerase
MRKFGWLLLLALAQGCGGPEGADAVSLTVRPYAIYVPPTYQSGSPWPVVVSLHGYTGTSVSQDGFFMLREVAATNGFILVTPEGTRDGRGQRFWNATPACCNIDKRDVDDFAYLQAVLDDVEAKYSVDKKRIYVTGHSNGAFMSHRLACDSANRIAAIVALSGAGFTEAGDCRPTEPVAVLSVHGDADTLIRYEGGKIGDQSYPGESKTVSDWAQRNGCSGDLLEYGEVDVDQSRPGAEAQQRRYGACRGAAVELWTLRGSGHVPSLGSSWAQLVWGFFSAHPKR